MPVKMVPMTASKFTGVALDVGDDHGGQHRNDQGSPEDSGGLGHQIAHGHSEQHRVADGVAQQGLMAHNRQTGQYGGVSPTVAAAARPNRMKPYDVSGSMNTSIMAQPPGPSGQRHRSA